MVKGDGGFVNYFCYLGIQDLDKFQYCVKEKKV